MEVAFNLYFFFIQVVQELKKETFEDGSMTAYNLTIIMNIYSALCLQGIFIYFNLHNSPMERARQVILVDD